MIKITMKMRFNKIKIKIMGLFLANQVEWSDICINGKKIAKKWEGGKIKANRIE